MANSYSFRNSSIDNFKVITWLLIFLITISPVITIRSALASAYSDAGWDISNRMAEGASTIINGVKNVGGAVARGTAKITPAAADVSKVLARGAGGYALTVAVEQLLGAVDWVLDPANNQITYKDPSQDLSNTKLRYRYYYTGYPSFYAYVSAIDTSTPNLNICAYLINPRFQVPKTFVSISNNTGSSFTCKSSDNIYFAINSSNNPLYDPAYEEPRKILPLDAVSDKIIANANAGDAAAQAVTGTAANDIANDDAKAPPIIAQLEATKTYDQAGTAAGTATKPNTADPTAPPEVTDLALEFPAFCGWAPIVCETAQTALNFMADFSNPSESGSVEVQSPNMTLQDSQIINFGNSCPAPETVSFSFMGRSESLEFSYQPLCQFMDMIRPFVIAASYLIGAYIVMGLSRGSGD